MKSGDEATRVCEIKTYSRDWRLIAARAQGCVHSGPLAPRGTSVSKIVHALASAETSMNGTRTTTSRHWIRPCRHQTQSASTTGQHHRWKVLAIAMTKTEAAQPRQPTHATARSAASIYSSPRFPVAASLCEARASLIGDGYSSPNSKNRRSQKEKSTTECFSTRLPTQPIAPSPGCNALASLPATPAKHRAAAESARARVLGARCISTGGCDMAGEPNRRTCAKSKVVKHQRVIDCRASSRYLSIRWSDDARVLRQNAIRRPK